MRRSRIWQRDPFERADTNSNNYRTWWIRRVFTLVPSQQLVGEFGATIRELPSRQKPAKSNVDDVLAQVKQAQSD